MEQMDKEDREILAKASKDKEVLGIVEKGKITIIDFYATWCPPCKRLGEDLHKVEGPEIMIKKVDVDNDNGLSERLGISAVPFVAVFNKNGKPVTAFTGYPGEEYLKSITEEARK